MISAKLVINFSIVSFPCEVGAYAVLLTVTYSRVLINKKLLSLEA